MNTPAGFLVIGLALVSACSTTDETPVDGGGGGDVADAFVPGRDAGGDSTTVDAEIPDASDASPADASPSPAKYIARIGGYCSSGVEVAPITAPGVLGSWTSQPAYPISFGQSAVGVVNDCFYSIGGYLCSGSIAEFSGYASAVTSGSLGSWGSVTALPGGAFTNRLIDDSGQVISLSGHGITAGKVYGAPLASACTLGSWTAQGDLPEARDYSAFVKTGGYVYYLGGDTGGMLKPTTAVYYAPISSGTIGAWQSTTALPTPGRFGHEAVTDGAYVYVIGGGDVSLPTSTIYVAPIQPGGALGAWTTTNGLPTPQFFFGAVVANGYLYISENGSTTVRSAPIGGGVVGTFSTTTAAIDSRSDQRLVAF